MKDKTILAIETSCDETAASLVKAKKTGDGYNIEILTNVVASQIDIHKKWGGVFPELASRAHLESIIPVINEALEPVREVKSKKLKVKSEISNKLITHNPQFIIQNFVDAIAVTTGPGLIGSLLMGVETAQVLASYFKKPVIPVNHLEGHIYSAFTADSQFIIAKSGIFPILALIVSGGHTSLVLMEKHLSYKTVGQTIDDAAGEAFDKVARILNLGYPGGPVIEKLAKSGDENAYKLPLSMLRSGDLNFSFSGLKTAVLYKTWDPKLQKNKKYNRANLAASFQKTIIEILTQKTIQAIKKYNPKIVILAGGVSANSRLREQFTSMLPRVLIPPKQLSTDNAVGIGIAGVVKFLENQSTHWSRVLAQAALNIESSSQY